MITAEKYFDRNHAPKKLKIIDNTPYYEEEAVYDIMESYGVDSVYEQIYNSIGSNSELCKYLCNEDEWVSSENGLPETDGFYLTKMKMGEREWLDIIQGETIEDTFYLYKYPMITHWQPITPPTK